MKEIISKELLCEVLGTGEIKGLISYCLSADERYIILQYDEFDDSINIHELAHKCKEWAALKDYEIYSLDGFAGMNPQGGDGGSSYFLDEFHGESEVEAIFKACQWILDNKEKC